MNTSSPAVVSPSLLCKLPKRPAILAASIGVLFGMLAACPPAKAATRTWDGVTGNPNWTFPGAPTNWTTGVLPVAGDDLQFSAAPINILNNNDFAAGTNFNSITFLGAAGPAYTLNGNAITLGAGGISNLSSATNTISFAGTGITLGASQTWNATNGVLNATSNVDLAGFNLTVDGAQNSTLSGTLSSAASSLTKNGTGMLTLSGANSYTGGTTLNGGVLALAGGGSLQSSGTVTINAGTFEFRDSTSAETMTIANSSELKFLNTSTASGAQIENNANNSHTNFSATNSGDAVTAGTATIINSGAGSYVQFDALYDPIFTSSTAGDAIIRNTGDFSRALFYQNATAGNATITNEVEGSFSEFFNDTTAGTASIDNQGLKTYTKFQDQVKAGSATLLNSGEQTSFLFNGSSDAENATITNSGKNSFTNFLDSSTANAATISNSGENATTFFIGDASGGTAQLINNSTNGAFDFSQLTSAGTTAGSIEGNGFIYLGPKNLSAGGNGLSTTFTGVIADGGAGGGAGGSLTKEGAGQLTLTAANTYTGGTTINGGKLATQNASALGSGPVALNAGGTLQVTNTLNTGAFTWNGGNIQLAPGVTPDIVNVTGAFTNGGAGGAYILDLTGITPGTTFTLTTFGTTTFALANFSAASTIANVTPQGTFLLNANNVQFTLTGVTATGPIIQNSAPVNTPTFADFLINGAVYTGGPTENNTIRSLIFTPGGSLRVNNLLTVTGGGVNLPGGASIQLNGFLSTSQLNLFINSLLGGNGGINGNLVNNGLVSPGNSPGAIRVSGNYTQSSTGALRIEVGGTTQADFDRLIVGGSAKLNGELQLVKLNRFELKRGDKITFLTAAGGVNGEFATVSNPFTSDTILTPEVVYGGTEVSLELVRGSFEKYAANWGLTPNQRAVASTLDRVSADKPNDQALVYLDGRKLAYLPGDFDKIAPEELTSIFTISTSLAAVQNTNLQRRTDDIRHGASGFSASGLAMQGTGPGYSGSLLGMAGPTGKETKEMKAPAPLEEKKWGVFLTGVGEWVDVGGDGNARGYDISTGGFTLGLDYKVTPNFVVGLAAGYAGTSADLTNGGDVSVNGGKLGVYATYFTGGFYADVAVTGGYNSYDTERSALQGTARGSTDGGELNVLVGAGYDWKVGALTIGPTATYQYSLVGINSFTETGSLAPLNIGSQNAESIRTTLGFKASYDWKVGGVLVRPEIRAAWQHEYGDSSYGLDASFANGAGSSFLVNGPEIGRDSLLIGAGVAIQCSDRFSTYLYYDGEIGRTNYDRHGVSGGVRVAF